jgi:O-antigen/teichoic acid export membrane protein
MNAGPSDTAATGRGQRFVTNVVWNWIGTAASLFSGLILSPILIRKLGPDGYGVWALSFAMADYYWFFDFGFRSATVKYVAHYTATGESDKVGEVISTSLIYAAMVGGGILAVVGLSAHTIVKFFQVAPGYQDTFAVVIVLVAVSWSLGLVLGLAAESLEAVQRFDLTSRAGVVATGSRAVCLATLLYLGYGIIPLAVVAVGSQMLGYVLNFVNFRKVFRGVPIGFRRGSRSTLRELGSFGIHSFMITISTQFQSQAAPVLIGHFLPAAFAGFYSLPMRLIQYTAEFVGRIGIVTNSTAAELSAKGDSKGLARLPIFTNRYCLVVFMPLAVMLWGYGRQFFEFWVGPKTAPYCASVLPILLAGNLIGMVGQFSSSMLLLGMGRHQKYARGMVAEMLAGLVLLVFIIPRFGIVGAAWITAALMAANRGLYLSYLVSRNIEMSLGRYLYEVYAGPLLSAIPALAIMGALGATILPGKSWFQLALAGGVAALAVYPLAFFTCVEPQHRRLIYSTVASQWSRFTK